MLDAVTAVGRVFLLLLLSWLDTPKLQANFSLVRRQPGVASSLISERRDRSYFVWLLMQPIPRLSVKKMTGWQTSVNIGYRYSEQRPTYRVNPFFYMTFACCAWMYIWWVCSAHEQHVRRTLTLTLTHTITAYSVSELVRVRILICATSQKPCRKRVYLETAAAYGMPASGFTVQ